MLLVRSSVCEVVTFYERWVNGGDLRVVELAAGRAPAAAPRPCSSAESERQAGVTSLTLAPYDGACGAPLPKLDASSLAPVSHILVHGSMATSDACAFSDVDVAVVLDDEREYPAAAHRAAVLELRRLLHAIYRYDPLMHHGLMFVAASDFRRYDQRFLPVKTLECARVLHGPPQVRVRLAPPPDGHFTGALRASASSLRRRVERRDFLADDYALKSVLSGALLMPARVLSAKGEFVYKRDSFDLARSLFTRREWEFIARCEALRSLWKRPPAPFLQRHVPSRAHPRLAQVAGARFAPRLNVSRISESMAGGLAAGASAFLDRLERIA